MVHGRRELVDEEPLHERKQPMDKDRVKGTIQEETSQGDRGTRQASSGRVDMWHEN
jgi:hypothetical protein